MFVAISMVYVRHKIYSFSIKSNSHGRDRTIFWFNLLLTEFLHTLHYKFDIYLNRIKTKNQTLTSKWAEKILLLSSWLLFLLHVHRSSIAGFLPVICKFYVDTVFIFIPHLFVFHTINSYYDLLDVAQSLLCLPSVICRALFVNFFHILFFY